MGELNIIPFLDITVNLMLFLLATTAVTLTTVEVRANLPEIHPGGGHGAPPTRLSVTLTERGVILGTGSGFVRPGCEDTSAGGTIAVPAVNGMFDGDGLRRCAARLHGALPEVNDVVLTADPEIAYADLIHAMDALRVDGETPLFPNVLISGGVR
jgi:biopolymer transport protein TolR